MPLPLSRPELPSSNRPRGRRIDVNNWNCPVIQMFCLLFLMSDMHWWFSIQKYILVSTPGEKKKERIDVVNCMKRTLEKIKYIYFINKHYCNWNLGVIPKYLTRKRKMDQNLATFSYLFCPRPIDMFIGFGWSMFPDLFLIDISSFLLGTKKYSKDGWNNCHV